MNANSRALTSDNPGSNNALASSTGYIQDSEVMATHASLFSVSAQQLSIPTTNHVNNGDQGTTRMGGQQPGTSRNDNEDWSTTITRRRRRKWGPFGGDFSVSESLRGKRKASYDAPETTRKIRKNSNYLEVSQCEQFRATSTTTSDTRPLLEVTQSEAEDQRYMVPVHSYHHFSSDGQTGFPALEIFEQPDQAGLQAVTQRLSQESLTPQESQIEEYPIPRQNFDDVYDSPRIWQPWRDLDRDRRLFQQGYASGENFTPHLGYPPERLAEISSI